MRCVQLWSQSALYLAPMSVALSLRIPLIGFWKPLSTTVTSCRSCLNGTLCSALRIFGVGSGKYSLNIDPRHKEGQTNLLFCPLCAVFSSGHFCGPVETLQPHLTVVHRTQTRHPNQPWMTRPRPLPPPPPQSQNPADGGSYQMVFSLFLAILLIRHHKIYFPIYLLNLFDTLGACRNFSRNNWEHNWALQ